MQNTAGNQAGSARAVRRHAGKRPLGLLPDADVRPNSWDVQIHDAHDHDGHDAGHHNAYAEGRHRQQQVIGRGEIYKQVKT